MAKTPQRTCPECGETFAERHYRQLFCTPAHSVAYNNRQLSRGQAIVGLVQAWRGARNSKDPEVKRAGKVAFDQLCRLADRYNAADRETGRGNPVQLFRAREARGLIET